MTDEQKPIPEDVIRAVQGIHNCTPEQARLIIASDLEAVRAAMYGRVERPKNADDLWGNPVHIPVITKTTLMAGAREDDTMYCRIVLTDVELEARAIDMSPDVALDLIAQLAIYVRQIGIK